MEIRSHHEITVLCVIRELIENELHNLQHLQLGGYAVAIGHAIVVF